MVRRILIALVCCGFLHCGSEESANVDVGRPSATEPVWTADPNDPGPDQPPAGRSLFDSLFAKTANGKVVHDIPFPFEKLTARIESSFPNAGRPLLRKVLIPIGRSLQRFANKPDYFGSPRVVVAADAEPAVSTGESPLRVKDRLFLGYQAKAAVIEIISYNEQAGRFEFQVISDYSEGAQPQVAYAQRQVCVKCHQGHGPIFSRPLWDETTANRKVRSRLTAHGSQFFGVRCNQGVDIPQLIDDATDRANLFSAYQLLWRQGCGESAQCRADALVAVLQYRLSGFQHASGPQALEKKRFSDSLAQSWKQKWPKGLKIPNPDIPNRDPLETARRISERAGNPEVFRTAGTAEFAELIDASFDNVVLEPRNPRQPLEVWRLEDAGTYDQVIAGFASFFSRADIRAIDGRLGSTESCEPEQFEAPCEAAVTQEAGESVLRFECASEKLKLTAWSLTAEMFRNGEISRLAIGDQPPQTYLQITGAKREIGDGKECYVMSPMQRSSGLRARLATGERVSEVKLCWKAGQSRSAGEFAATAHAAVCDDFSSVRHAVGAMVSDESDALSGKPLRPSALMADLKGRL